MICVVEIMASIINIFFIKTREGADSLELPKAFSRGITFSSLIICIGLLATILFLNIRNATETWTAGMFGLLAGLHIGKATEYFMFETYARTRMIAQNAPTGSARVIISGFGRGVI
jgi:K(+)-stimulated pyrophosphate-energized sodium pump